MPCRSMKVSALPKAVVISSQENTEMNLAATFLDSSCILMIVNDDSDYYKHNKVVCCIVARS